MTIPATLKVWFSPAAATKHSQSLVYFAKQGVLTNKEGESTHRVVSKGELRNAAGGRALSLSMMMAELRAAVS